MSRLISVMCGAILAGVRVHDVCSRGVPKTRLTTDKKKKKKNSMLPPDWLDFGYRETLAIARRFGSQIGPRPGRKRRPFGYDVLS